VALFAAVGFDHVIANMFFVQMGMFLGNNVSYGESLVQVVDPLVAWQHPGRRCVLRLRPTFDHTVVFI